jgi:hypothetical protein
MIPSERIHGSDLLPLPIAAALVYDSLASHLEAARTTEEVRDRLDGAAVALASLAPIYRTDGDEPLVIAESALATGRFTDGAETLRFSNGEEPISALAIRRGDLYTAIEQIKTARHTLIRRLQ